MPAIVRAHLRPLIVATAAAALVIVLAGCQPEPATTDAATTAPASASPSQSSAAPTASASPSAEAGDDISLPTTCDQLYSAPLRATLDATIPPLNDPGVTMYSTQTVEALEVLDSGAPTIRCTWGVPSESGISTNVSIIDAPQAEKIRSALQGAGLGCQDALGGTLCTLEERSITQDDTEVVRVETQFFRGNAWVTTVSLNAAVDGYTDDIVSNLWG